MIFTTQYTKPDGSIWEGQRINAISFTDAEEQASDLGLELVGKLEMEGDWDETNWNIDINGAIDHGSVQSN